MFTSKPKAATPPKKASAPRDANAVTILTSGCHFSGKLYCRGSSRIAGKIDGQIISEGFLVIEEEAVITAEIKADEAVIQGRVEGKLQATSRVELCASSQFGGDIITPVLVVREGAHFNGHAQMPPKEDAVNTKGPRLAVSQGKEAKQANSKTPHFEGAAKADVASFKAPDISVTRTP